MRSIARLEMLFSSEIIIPLPRFKDSSQTHNVTILEWSIGIKNMDFAFSSQTRERVYHWQCGISLLDIDGLRILREFIGEGLICKINYKTLMQR